MLRATKIAEAAGVPGVAIISSGFMAQAKATARAMGMPDASIAEYPGMIPMDSDDALADLSDPAGAVLGVQAAHTGAPTRG